MGVADPTFHGTIVSYDVELFIPVMMAPQLGFTFGSQQTTPSGILSDRRAGVFYPQGYLRPGTTLASATAQADALWATLSRERPLTDAAQRLKVVRFWQTPGSGPTFILPTLTVLSPMGLLVLMIACANIAGLVLVRGLSRRGEIAVRLALGATRARIVRLLVVENLVLAVPGAVFGVLLARNATPVLVSYAERLAAPQRIFFNIEVDGLVIGFTALVACGSALVFGFVPALHSSRVDLVSVINEDASPRGAARGRLRAGLVVAQVAVSLLLLVGAGLATRSVDAARRANPGFDASQVTAIELDVKQNALRRSRAGASSIASCWTPREPIPASNRRRSRRTFRWDCSIRACSASRSKATNRARVKIWRSCRTPSVRTTSARFGSPSRPVGSSKTGTTRRRRRWRSSTPRSRNDSGAARRTRLASEYASAIGEWRTVVGVAADVKYSRINEAPRPYFYLPFLQAYRSTMILHTRGAGAGRPSRRPGARACCGARRRLADPGREADGRHRCRAR